MPHLRSDRPRPTSRLTRPVRSRARARQALRRYRRRCRANVACGRSSSEGSESRSRAWGHTWPGVPINIKSLAVFVFSLLLLKHMNIKVRYFTALPAAVWMSCAGGAVGARARTRHRAPCSRSSTQGKLLAMHHVLTKQTKFWGEISVRSRRRWAPARTVGPNAKGVRPCVGMLRLRQLQQP